MNVSHLDLSLLLKQVAYQVDFGDYMLHHLHTVCIWLCHECDTHSLEELAKVIQLTRK